jgi:hypothetical protein
MKKLKILFAIVIIALVVNSCKDDEPFYQVNAFETALHEYINEYRIAQGKSSLVWNFDIFVEARQQSVEFRKTGDYTTGLNTRIGQIQDNWVPEKLQFVQASAIGQADTSWARAIVNSMIADSAINVILLDDYNQYGAGMSQGDDAFFSFQFFLKINTK